jgi:hypothetical protein
MRYQVLFLLLSYFISGCGLRQREQELDKRLLQVNQKEQELLLKEKSLQLKEDELAKKEKLLDSTTKNQPDSFFTRFPQVMGKWNVTMRCTETNCSGSAVGDTKNEQWEIHYQNQTIVAEAFSDNKLVRVYSGSNSGSSIELSTEQENADTNTKATRMIVRIQEIRENEMTGQRDIIRPDNCHIVYSLEFKR